MLVRRSLGRLAVSRYASTRHCVRAGLQVGAIEPLHLCHTITVQRTHFSTSDTQRARVRGPAVKKSFSRYVDDDEGSDSAKREARDEIAVEEVNEDEIDLEDEMLKIQNTGIQYLESLLGKSLEKAVFEDQIADKLLSGPYATRVTLENEQVEVETDDVAVALEHLSEFRDQGAAITEVVREARNIFGDYLPQDALNAGELILYKRLYGEPLEMEEAEDDDLELDGNETEQNTLFNAEGEKVEYELEDEDEIAEDTGNVVDCKKKKKEISKEHYSPMTLDDAGRAADIAKIVGGDIVDDPDDDGDNVYEDGGRERAHPLTSFGRFATHPRTTFIPKETFTEPIQGMLRDVSNKHLREAAEKIFDGAGLPKSPLTPRIGRAKEKVAIPLEAGQRSMTPMEANVFMSVVMPPVYASIQSTVIETRKRLGASWLNGLLSKQGGPRVLDAGSGGAGALVWNEITSAHWNSMNMKDQKKAPLPGSKMVVLTGSDALRKNVSQLLDNTTFVPRLPDLVNIRDKPTLEDDRPAQKRKLFDVIISSHSLFPLQEEWQRKQYVENLWSMLSDQGGVLIMLEKGINRGFEAIAGARELLLDKHIAVPDGQATFYSKDSDVSSDGADKRTPGMIIAPCTNHERCPLYQVTGHAVGRKDSCSFQQRYIRPPFLQNILGAKDLNFDDVDFSYISILKGEDLRRREFSSWEHVSDPLSAPRVSQENMAQNADSQTQSAAVIQQGFEDYDPTWSSTIIPPPAHVLPRMIMPPFKKAGHITMDLCTPQAEIRRWTIPRSFSRQAYRDARKSQWGDLWALGAKTNIARNLKVGKPQEDVLKAAKESKAPRDRIERATEQAVIDQANEESDLEKEEELFQKMLDEDGLLDVGDGEEEDDDKYAIDMNTFAPKKNNVRKFTHAKIDGVHVQPPAKSKKDKQRAETDFKRSLHPKMIEQQEVASAEVEFDPTRYGAGDILSDWASVYDERSLDDHARRSIEKSGRRATSKNTYRFKKDLRRAKRESGSI